MDPMDFTMDEAASHGNQGSSGASRYQCQQSSPSAQNTFAPHSRDGPHYDPVHDNSRFLYANNGNTPGLAYPAMQHPQHWGSSPFMPSAGWQGYGDMSRGSAPPYSLSSRGLPLDLRQYADSSWGNSRPSGRGEADRMGDAYGAFSNQLNGHTLPDNTIRTGGNSIGGDSNHSSALRPSLFAQTFEPQQTHVDTPSQPGTFHTRVPSFGTAGRTNRQPGPSHSFPEPPNLRYQRAPRPGLPRHGINSSTVPNRQSWGESDDDGLSDPEEDAVRREVLSYRMGDEERALVMADAVAAGRRLLAQEALSSLEKVKLEDVAEDASKDCEICYNEYGIPNPDGVTEHRVRLSKCQHVFGNECIKRWFEEGKDTCPYCRTKIPSELASKRLGMETQIRAMQRRRMQAAVVAQHAQQQGRHGVPPHVGFFPEDAGSARTSSTPSHSSRPQDDYEAMMNRSSENWNHSYAHRYSPGESPERRRQNRGRVGTGRSGHPMGRPASIGSARSVSQSFSFHHNPPQRTFNPPAPSLHAAISARRSITPGLPRPSGTHPQTPQTRASASLPGSASSSPEAASPPVAVGSGLSARHRFSVDSASNFSRDIGRSAEANGHQQRQPALQTTRFSPSFLHGLSSAEAGGTNSVGSPESM